MHLTLIILRLSIGSIAVPNQNLGEMRFTNNANRKLLHFGKRNMDALVNEIIRDLVFPFISGLLHLSTNRIQLLQGYGSGRRKN